VKVCLLLDENLSPLIKRAIRQYSVEIDVLRVGEQGAPPLSTPDPEIL